MDFSSIEYVPNRLRSRVRDMRTRARTKSGVLEPPEGLVGFSKRLFPRDADILQEVEVVAIGNFAQRPALAGTRKPSADCRACAGDEPAKLRFRTRQGAWSDIPEEQPVGNQGGHGRAPMLVPGRSAGQTERDQ